MIFLQDFFKDIPRILVHYWQIITNFLFVCQSFSWLTSLMKLGQNRDISCGQDIFWKLLVAIPGCFCTISKQLQISSMSVSPLVGLLPYFRMTPWKWRLGKKILRGFLALLLPFWQMQSPTSYSPHWLTSSYPHWLAYWIAPKILKIYVNNDAGTLKFGI